jgi:RHS repeat-associated protein
MRKSGVTYYYMRDAVSGSVAGVVRESDNATVSSFDYTPYGELLDSLDFIGTSLRFASREYDPETRLYYNRARYYDPLMGRFVSEDPIGLEGGINLYAYAGNDPINKRDPTGLAEVTCPTGWNSELTEYDDGSEHMVCKPPAAGGSGFGRLGDLFGSMGFPAGWISNLGFGSSRFASTAQGRDIVIAINVETERLEGCPRGPITWTAKDPDLKVWERGGKLHSVQLYWPLGVLGGITALAEKYHFGYVDYQGRAELSTSPYQFVSVPLVARINCEAGSGMIVGYFP